MTHACSDGSSRLLVLSALLPSLPRVVTVSSVDDGSHRRDCTLGDPSTRGQAGTRSSWQTPRGRYRDSFGGLQAGRGAHPSFQECLLICDEDCARRCGEYQPTSSTRRSVLEQHRACCERHYAGASEGPHQEDRTADEVRTLVNMKKSTSDAVQNIPRDIRLTPQAEEA